MCTAIGGHYEEGMAMKRLTRETRTQDGRDQEEDHRLFPPHSDPIGIKQSEFKR